MDYELQLLTINENCSKCSFKWMFFNYLQKDCQRNNHCSWCNGPL